MSWYLTVHLTIMSLGIMAGAFRFRFLPLSVRYFYFLLWVSLITEIIAWYVGKLYGSNLIVYHLFIVIQFTLIVLAYQQELINYKRWLLLSLILLICISLVNTILKYDTAFVEYPAIVRTCSNLLIVGWSLIYLRTLINEPEQGSFKQYPLFWISLGWLLFISVTFFSLGAFNVVNASSSSLAGLFKYLRITANFVLYILFLVAFTSEQRTLSVVNHGQKLR